MNISEWVSVGTDRPGSLRATCAGIKPGVWWAPLSVKQHINTLNFSCLSTWALLHDPLLLYLFCLKIPVAGEGAWLPPGTTRLLFKFAKCESLQKFVDRSLLRREGAMDMVTLALQRTNGEFWKDQAAGILFMEEMDRNRVAPGTQVCVGSWFIYRAVRQWLWLLCFLMDVSSE